MRLSKSLRATSVILLGLLTFLLGGVFLGDLGHHLLFTVHSSWHVVAPSEH